ncbi:MAG TPA: hypothetical protein VFS00_08380 [Polyangiaceae bacterium]|nr:hypothetical protein [Polyangiaceae bacterium]
MASPRELGEAYYELGPADQYLIRSGRTYFGGLARLPARGWPGSRPLSHVGPRGPPHAVAR